MKSKLSVTIPIGKIQMRRQGCMGYSIPISILGQTKFFLLDTGSQKSVISPKTVKELNISMENANIWVRGANSNKVNFSKCVTGDITVGSNKISKINFLICPISHFLFGSNCAGILGSDILYRLDFDIEMSRQIINISGINCGSMKFPLLNVTLNRCIHTTASLDTAANCSWLSDCSRFSCSGKYYSLIISFTGIKIVKKEDYGDVDVCTSSFFQTIRNIGKGPAIIRNNNLVGIVLGNDVLKNRKVSFNNGVLSVEESKVLQSL